MPTFRPQSIALRAIPVLIAATLSSQAVAQTTTSPAPVINNAAIDRLSLRPSISLTARGKPRTQSTWCRATGTQPASKMVPRGTVSYGKGVLLSNQIGACSARPPGL